MTFFSAVKLCLRVEPKLVLELVRGKRSTIINNLMQDETQWDKTIDCGRLLRVRFYCRVSCLNQNCRSETKEKTVLEMVVLVLEVVA